MNDDIRRLSNLVIPSLAAEEALPGSLAGTTYATGSSAAAGPGPGHMVPETTNVMGHHRNFVFFFVPMMHRIISYR